MSTKIYHNVLIDKETGEILREYKVFRTDSNYKYIQVTMNDTEHIEMLTGNQYKLTGILAKYIQFETNIIELSPNQKKRLADSMGLKIRTFYTLFNSLKDAGWIMDHRGYTIMNPMYIWAGKVSNRSKLIEEIKEDRLEAI